MHISHTKSFNTPVSIALATLAHMINVYEIRLNTTNYLILNMQDFNILSVDLHFGMFWSAGIPTMLQSIKKVSLSSQNIINLYSKHW